jgi:hypothetical protein
VTPAFEAAPPPVPSWEQAAAEAAAPAAAASAASAFASSPPETGNLAEDWPAPGHPETQVVEQSKPLAPDAPAIPVEQKASPTWSPVQTSEWTPGRSHISSSEWTGEATPVPAPVPEEFRTSKTASAPPAAAAEAPVMAPAATASAPPIPRAPAPAPVRKPKEPKARRPSFELPFERPRWLVPAAAGVIVLLLLGAGGVYLAGHLGQPSSSVAASPHPSASTGKASPTPSTGGIHQVPVYAPTAAAPISGVHFCTPATPCIAPGLPNATDTSCTLGGSCKVDVGIFYSPPYGGPVSYKLEFFDRCTGVTTDLPGRTATAGNSQFPKFSVSEVSTSVSLPSGAKSAALVAVTTAPSAVASPALLLGSDSC